MKLAICIDAKIFGLILGKIYIVTKSKHKGMYSVKIDGKTIPYFKERFIEINPGIFGKL